MSIPVASIGGLNLPLGFSYKPYVQKKRMSTAQTAGGVSIQTANPQIVHGDGLLEWTIQGCYAHEYQDLLDLYNTSTPVAYTFNGYWGDVLSVYIVDIDPGVPRGGVFDVSGIFQVLAVTTPQNAVCPT